MRVLVINQYFHPDLASTAQLLTELCEDLAALNEVWVVCGRPSYNADSRAAGAKFSYPGVTVRRAWSTSFSRVNMAGRLANYATYLVSSTWEAMRAPKPDVILTMTDPPIVAAVSFLVSRARRAPFVYVCQDVFPDTAVAFGKMSDGLARRAFALMNRFLRARAAAVVAIGRDMRERLIRLGTSPEKIEVIPNWADGAILRPGGGAAFRKEQGWDDRFVVMHSGNVGLSQSLETVIDAATALREDAEILFVIVGEGAAKHVLEQDVRDRGLANVRFLPYQPKERLAESLGAADLHLVMLKEGLAGAIVPSKVYGIMAVGKPFVAAVEEGSEAALVVEEAGCGVLARPGHAEDLVRAITEARASDLPAIGKAGRTAFEEGFDRPEASAAYEALLERVVGRPA